MTVHTEAFPPMQWHVTQELVDAYAEVSGDRNPLHIDPEFAKTTRFGSTIAHGFLTIAWLSQWASTHYGVAWIERGLLNITFIGAVLPGDTVTVSAEPAPDAEGENALRVTCRAGEREVVVGILALRTE